MTDWRSYDAIADAYDQRWLARFEEAARRLLAFAGADRATRLLDLGTGTGAVLAALGARRKAMARVVGCDLSFSMVSRARRHAPMSPVVATVTRLPFHEGTFDLVTANFVVSHVHDHGRVLAESRRVLRASGIVAVSSWGPASDAYSDAWNELLGSAVGGDAARKALEEVAPSEAFWSTAENVVAALRAAGFEQVRVEITELEHACSVAEYLAGRELNAGGRFGRHTLGERGWRQFLDHAEAEFRRRFGEVVRYARPVVLGVGTTT